MTHSGMSCQNIVLVVWVLGTVQVLLQPSQRMSSFQHTFCQLLLCLCVILSNCLVSKQNYSVNEHTIRNKTLRESVCRRGRKERIFEPKGDEGRRGKEESHSTGQVSLLL